MPGWKGSTRRADLPPGWNRIRDRILMRDQYQCRHVRTDSGTPCLALANQVDHIVSHADGGSDEDYNLIALCAYHHGQKSGREGGLASGAARRAQGRPERPTHPGLLP